MKKMGEFYFCEICKKAKGWAFDHSECSKKLQELTKKPHRNTKSSYAYSEKRINKFLKFVD